VDEMSAQMTTPSTSRFGMLTGIAAAIAIAIAAGTSRIAYRATRPAELKPLVRLDVDLGTEVSLGSPFGTDAIISPDGTRLVYVSQSRLFTRRLDQAKSTMLTGTGGASAPFFSPDGQWVAFFAEGKLKKISVEGGTAVTVSDTGSGTTRGGSWGEDGNIIVSLSLQGLSRIPSAGGPPTPVTELAQGEHAHRWPQILPGGKAALFTVSSSAINWDAANIEVVSLKDGRRKILVTAGTFGRYLPSGHLVYVNKGTLFAVPFDLDKLEVRSTPSPVLEEVAYSVGSGSAQFDFSRSGTLLYRGGVAVGGGALFTVQWLDVAGKTQPLLAKTDSYLYPRLSPDGQRLALSAGDIWIYEWQRDTMTRLTFTGGAIDPVWSPDGRYIVFQAPNGGMFWTRSDGAGKPQSLTQNKNLQVPYSFTPDGKRLAFHQAPRCISGPFLWRATAQACGPESRRFSCKRSSASGSPPSVRTGGGWLMLRMSRECIRCTCARFPTKAASGRSRTTVAGTRCFRATEASSSSKPRTIASWWQPTRRRVIRSWPISRGCGPRRRSGTAASTERTILLRQMASALPR